MAEHIDTGKQGEAIAEAYLVRKGYNILERNWYNVHQEIDIIAEKNGELIIVEVKCRSEHPVVEPQLAVNRKKQKMLILAANNYIQQNELDMDTRFDVITVILGKNVKTFHIKNAFYPIVR
ncbi:MAG: YraN family protein [Bacteroidales bacterium]|jgi:putative endonuclease|nr:YraN family protein [Bacteroidales bacterium]